MNKNFGTSKGTENYYRLLELAAKAVGYGEVWYSTKHEHYFVEIDGIAQPWNPLIDDGDALRLMVKLQLMISPRNCGIVRAIWWRNGIMQEATDSAKDTCIATRHVIVRAAAEIGRVRKERKG